MNNLRDSLPNDRNNNTSNEDPGAHDSVADNDDDYDDYDDEFDDDEFDDVEDPEFDATNLPQEHQQQQQVGWNVNIM